MFKGMEYRSYFDLIEPIFMKYGGRPHWGKMHTRRADDLRSLYPRWSHFQAARDALDPARTFTSPYLAQVLGE
jgi:FAD/FMN-containing dehydrogenase